MNVQEKHVIGHVETAIRNLEILSDALKKCADNPSVYNSDFGYYLEQMSGEMCRTAREMKKRKQFFSGR